MMKLTVRIYLMCLLSTLMNSGGWLSRTTAADSAIHQVRETAATAVWGTPSHYSLCGVYAAYGCLSRLGLEPSLQQMIQPEYVGSDSGSRAVELVSLIEASGASAKLMRGLTCSELEALPGPVILHVASERTPQMFNHWVLCEGASGGNIQIVDMLGGRHQLKAADLMSRWNGIGILVTAQPVPLGWFQLKRSLEWLSVLGIAALSMLLVRRIVHMPAGRPALWRGTMQILLASGIVAAGYHCLAPEGFARSTSALGLVRAAYNTPHFDDVSISECRSIVADDAALIIDARYPNDFQAGHLPAAINVPFFATLNNIREILQDLPTETSIVLYCQSEHCGFDDEVARSLSILGFHNVRMFPAGWLGWNSASMVN